MTRTPGADTAVIQSVADEYDETMERYMRYQDYLFAQDKLEGYERKMYLRRRRQSLLWQLLLNDTIEGAAGLPRRCPARARAGRRGRDRRRARRGRRGDVARARARSAGRREDARGRALRLVGVTPAPARGYLAAREAMPPGRTKERRRARRTAARRLATRSTPPRSRSSRGWARRSASTWWRA